MPRSFALGDRFDRLIDRLVKGGRYNNASEVVREGLRMVEDKEKQRAKSVGHLRALVEESQLAGGATPAEEVRARLLKHVRSVKSRKR